jgi:hypothetical protein
MRHDHATHEVEYQHGDDLIAVLATVGRSAFPVSGADGGILNVERRDYLVRAVDLVLDDGTAFKPAVGDKITETNPDLTLSVYEVVQTGDEKHYRKSDPDGLTLRIHTTFVQTRPPRRTSRPPGPMLP